MAVSEPEDGAVCTQFRWLSSGWSKALATLLSGPLLSELLTLDVLQEVLLREVEPVEEEEL